MCIVWQLSGSSESWCKAWAVAWCTRGFSLWRYLTSGATAPSRPKAVRLLPQAQHRAMASARCRRRRSFWVLVSWARVGTTPWSVMTAKFSSSLAMLAIAAQTELWFHGLLNLSKVILPEHFGLFRLEKWNNKLKTANKTSDHFTGVAGVFDAWADGPSRRSLYFGVRVLE